jgi:hypothetical protein
MVIKQYAAFVLTTVKLRLRQIEVVLIQSREVKYRRDEEWLAFLLFIHFYVINNKAVW